MTKAGPCARVIVNKCNDLKGGGPYWEEVLSAFCLFFCNRYESMTPIPLKAFHAHL